MQTLPFKTFLEELWPERQKNPALTPFIETLETIPPLHRNGPWLVGGTMRRLLACEPLTTDYDIMFKNTEQFETFCGQMRERGAEVISESDNQITYLHEGNDIQAIRASYSNTLIQTLNTFDFTICQFGFDGNLLVWGDESMEHVKSKSLVFTKSDDLVSSFRRMFKYANQGFYMDSDAIVKFLKYITKETEKIDKAKKKYADGGKVDGGSFGATAVIERSQFANISPMF